MLVSMAFNGQGLRGVHNVHVGCAADIVTVTERNGKTIRARYLNKQTSYNGSSKQSTLSCNFHQSLGGCCKSATLAVRAWQQVYIENDKPSSPHPLIEHMYVFFHAPQQDWRLAKQSVGRDSLAAGTPRQCSLPDPGEGNEKEPLGLGANRRHGFVPA